MLATLKQRRYLGLFGIGVVVATICILAGTWQIARFEQKHSANDTDRANNRAPVTDIVKVLGPSVPAGTLSAQKLTATERDAARFTRVSATGTYLVNQQTLLRGQTINNVIGYLVITPLRTADGVLFVARGFVPQDNSAEQSPKSIAAPPSGTVTLTGRLQPADTAVDKYGTLPGVQVDTLNTAQQADRFGASTWHYYAELLDGQPGTQGLTALPAPDMSNPAGGAVEPQHAAYVLQWYLFAGLALGAPFILAAAERRRDRAEDPDSARPSLDDRLSGRA